MQMYVPVHKDQSFQFHQIRARKKDIQITTSDAKYGGVKIKPILMEAIEGDVAPAPMEGQDVKWCDQPVAWVFRNPDGSYWLDTLELTRDETLAWATNHERMEKAGFKAVPVRFTLV